MPKRPRYATRMFVLRRDEWVCQLCKEPIDPDTTSEKWRWTVDHIIPRVVGGSHSSLNLRAAHGVCNWNRGAQYTLADAQSLAEVRERDRAYRARFPGEFDQHEPGPPMRRTRKF